MKEVSIYTDGACSGNPGKGGWGAILIYGNNEKELSGGEEQTTNNRMEVYAAIAALSALKERCAVTLYSDSAYLVNAIAEGWLAAWKRNGFVNAANKPVKNRDLWEKLDELLCYHKVEFVKVKGHADNEYNNRCDALARGEIKKLNG
ncbi:MAG: ribonuclease HI [Clostridiales bacterium]|nr:ribonuclease HI [Clostridiales bacterium]